MIENFGGLSGVRDYNLLLSCVESPKMTMFGEDLYPSVFDKAAIYLFNIVQNHPFNDGNKRTGAGVTYLFLQINKAPILFDSKDDVIYEKLIVRVAKGNVDKDDIAYFFEHGKERSIKNR